MSNLSILKMIMHDLDLKKNSPNHFDHVIDVKSLDSEITDFFCDHIENVMKNRKIQNCRFNHEYAAVLQDCLEIANALDDEQLFVDNTKNISTLLFNEMKKSSSISSGALIFVQFINNHNGSQFISILKMDPNKAIQLDASKNTFKVQTDILPNVKQSLHKCAIIKLELDLWDQEIQLRVLDKQQSKGEVSKFFLLHFLEARKITNDKSMTNLVHNQLIAHVIEEQIIDVSQLGPFSREVDQFLTPNRNVDLERDLDGLLSPYVEGDAELEGIIDSFKLKLLAHDENAYFCFIAERDKEKNYVINDRTKNLKVQFPIQYLGREIQVDDLIEHNEKKGRIITIRDLDLEEKVI